MTIPDNTGNTDPLTIYPRNGEENPVWIASDLQTKAQRKISTPGVSLCIDGPTGTGKTSLAITLVAIRDCNFIRIQCASDWKWCDFVRRFIESFDHNNELLKSTIEVSISLKGIGINYSVSRESSSESHLSIGKKKYASNTLTASHVAEICQCYNITLVIDDLEKSHHDDGHDELPKKVADLIKFFADTFRNSEARIIAVGRNNIYQRICKHDESLIDRLPLVTLGTLAHSGVSWAFLTKSFDARKMTHPGNPKYDPKTGNKPLKWKNERDACIEYVYLAANGLLKSLASLGRSISESSGTSNVTTATIKQEAKTMILDSLDTYQSLIPGFIEQVARDSGMKRLLHYLFTHGTGKAHNLAALTLSSDLHESDRIQLVQAYHKLKELNFITHVGVTEDSHIFYANDPKFAHLIGSLQQIGREFGVRPDLTDLSGQLDLGLED